MGQYSLPDGRKVSYTDGDVVKDVADLYAIVQGEYKGTPSMESEVLKGMLADLQAGKVLSDVEWSSLHRIEQRYKGQLAKFRSSPDNESEGFVPVPSPGTGRITESMGVFTPSERRRIRENYKTASTTTKDQETTSPHLLDGVLHDLAHAAQHATRLHDPDVRGNKASMDFNLEHLEKHLDSARDHASRLGQHLEKSPSNPKTFAAERSALTQLREAAQQGLPGIFSKAQGGYGDMWINDAEKRINISFGDWEGDLSTAAHAVAARMFPDYKIDSETEQGDPSNPRRYNSDTKEIETTQAPGWRQVFNNGKQVGQLREATALGQTTTPIMPTDPTICVDFDGTIHQGPHGLPGNVEGVLIKGAAGALKQLSDRFKVVVLTARVDVAAVRDWLDAQGVGKYVDEVTNRKPPASAYIDDRATHFSDWDSALKAIDPDVAVTEVPAVVKTRTVAEVQAARPPHLREATGAHRCGTCDAFKAGRCQMYSNTKVSPGQVCDSWTDDPSWRLRETTDPTTLSLIGLLMGDRR